MSNKFGLAPVDIEDAKLALKHYDISLENAKKVYKDIKLEYINKRIQKNGGSREFGLFFWKKELTDKEILWRGIEWVYQLGDRLEKYLNNDNNWIEYFLRVKWSGSEVWRDESHALEQLVNAAKGDEVFLSMNLARFVNRFKENVWDENGTKNLIRQEMLITEDGE